MKRSLIVMLLMLLLVSPAAAQEWAPDGIGAMEYNCFLIDHIIGDFGDAAYLLRDGEAVAVEDMLLQLASGCKIGTEASGDLPLLEIMRSWPFIYQDENSYQCDMVNDIIADYGSFDFQRSDSDSDALTVFTYHQKKAPYCLPRYIIAAKDFQLRDCLDSPCETNEYMLRGEALPVVDRVVGEDETWYEVAREFKHYLEVETEDATAFVNAADVVFGPAGFVELDKSYYILHENHTPHCQVFPRREDAPFVHVSVIKAGGAYQEMLVDITAPLTESPMPIKEEAERAFSDSGAPYIHQLYDPMIIAVGAGIYTIDLTLDAITYRFGFDLTEAGIYRFHIHCK